MQCYMLFTASISLAARIHSAKSGARELIVLVDPMVATVALALRVEDLAEVLAASEVEGRLDSDKSQRLKKRNAAG